MNWITKERVSHMMGRNNSTKLHALYVAHVWDWRLQGVREVARHEREVVSCPALVARTTCCYGIYLCWGRTKHEGTAYVVMISKETTYEERVKASVRECA
jgi:hypothetical protein